MNDWVEVPWESLESGTLQNLLEEFVTRDGTDYGEHESSLQSRVRQVAQGLKEGRYLIVFSQSQALANIVECEQWRLLNQ